MQRGFTLVEMLVTTGIFVFFSILILVENNKFNDVILLRDLSYNVALSVREAQVYGLGVREFQSDQDFDQGYGVNFNVTSATSYVLFIDSDNNGLYAGLGADFLNQYSLSNRNRITDFCATRNSNTSCAAAGDIDELHITFLRPDPDAVIKVDNDAGTLYDRAEIVLESPRGDQLSVLVESTGQISVP